jgi:hypothetical protein
MNITFSQSQVISLMKHMLNSMMVSGLDKTTVCSLGNFFPMLGMN